MKGFVSTPLQLVDQMVSKLFEERAPSPTDVVLDPGCGRGEFIAGILRWCNARGVDGPTIVGVENDPHHWAPAHERFLGNRRVKIRRRDFLKPDTTEYEFIIGNPPYVPITGLSLEERDAYRRAGYVTASGRMDLYLLFFEAALARLRPGGRLVFVTPEKYLYVATAKPLRRLLDLMHVESVELLPERTFPGLTTYPAVTTVDFEPAGLTQFIRRDGTKARARLPPGGGSWLPTVTGYKGARQPSPSTLGRIALRISPGIATGADRVFVVDTSVLAKLELDRFAYPTISGRDLKPGKPLPTSSHSMLVPYSASGRLQTPDQVERLLSYLSEPERRERLESRTCARRKPWYAFHDAAPLSDILRPKIVWKDICEEPHFWIDRVGGIVPRHSVYYLVPRDPDRVDAIAEYLASDRALGWIRSNCQRAANGFLRLQSNVLREMPIPPTLAAEV